MGFRTFVQKPQIWAKITEKHDFSWFWCILWNLVFFFEILKISEIHDFSRFVGIYPRYPKNYRIKRGPPALGCFELNKKCYQRKGIWAGAPKSFLVADNFSISGDFQRCLIFWKRSFSVANQQNQALKQ